MSRLHCIVAAALAAAALVPALISTPAAAQGPKPAVTLDSVLNFFIYDSGLMRMHFTDVAFAPEGAVNASVAIRDGGGAEIASWSYYEDYRVRQAVFGRMSPNNQAQHTFAAGDYALEFVIAGETATRIPFSVETHSTSDDPFNPGTKLKFVGPWQKWAYLAPNGQDADSAAAIHFWAGKSDFDGDGRPPATYARVYRNGTLIAHSNPRTGDIWTKPAQRSRYFFQKPHEAAKSHLAPNVTIADLSQDGAYRITIDVVETGETIREFAYRAEGGKIVPHPRTVLGHQPRTEYIPPRVPVFGGSTYEFTEAHWIAAP